MANANYYRALIANKIFKSNLTFSNQEILKLYDLKNKLTEDQIKVINRHLDIT